MADQPFIGEIRMFAGNFAPAGWALCEGQVMPISQNAALFSLIGTTYGGDGVNTFALPDLRSRVPMSQGQGPGLSSYIIGESEGEETVTLTLPQIPAHRHVLQAVNAIGSFPDPVNSEWAELSAVNAYSSIATNASMDAGAIGTNGGSQPHDNMLPFLAINFIIALFGIFPSRN
jgi:microcystin-dependent protein